MTRAEIRAYGVTLGGALILIAVILGAHGLVDAIDRRTDAQLAEHADRMDYRRWAKDACTPANTRETAIIKHDGARLHCRIYSDAERGMVPSLVSVAVLEPPL